MCADLSASLRVISTIQYNHVKKLAPFFKTHQKTISFNYCPNLDVGIVLNVAQCGGTTGVYRLEAEGVSMG